MTIPYTSTGALGRLSESAGRILYNLGGAHLFRRLVSTKDVRRGSETWSPDGGTEVEASAHRFWGQRKKADGHRERVERVAVEKGPFEDFGGLSDVWQIQVDGTWVGLGNVALSEDATCWEADLRPPAVEAGA